jgi:predicted dehydrogenase
MKSYNIAIIGAGNIGKIHAQAIASVPSARLTMVFDMNQENSQQLAQEFGATSADSLYELFSSPDVDAVAICTPSGYHASAAIPAAEHGKHLLVEKPLDITLARIDSMIAAARENNIILAGVFPSRFRQGIQATRKAILAGRLGKIMFIQGSIKWFRSREYYQGSWRGSLEVDGGGALINQGIHTIDLVQWLGGPVKSILAQTDTLHHKIEAEDTASALLKFESGAQGIIAGATSCWPGDPARIEVHGDAGTIFLEEGRIVRWDLKDSDADETEKMLNLEVVAHNGSKDPTAIGIGGHRRQYLDFIAALNGESSPFVGGAEARKAVEIIHAIYKSAKNNTKINLPIE